VRPRRFFAFGDGRSSDRASFSLLAREFERVERSLADVAS
jgi:hypothetical protein